jgi:hypothetical protein
MEVAIRAINLLAGFKMVSDSPLIGSEETAVVLKTLIAHGRYIRNNLEFSYRVRSNHYLSNLIGLFVLGTSLPDLADSREWVELSSKHLLSEFETQVLSDGISYEASIGYHRLVLEIYALFFSSAFEAGTRPEPRHWRKLNAMFDFVLHYLKPDGEAPALGDSDDGRLFNFSGCRTSHHGYLLDIGAALFGEPAFKQTDTFSEEAIWWLGQSARDRFAALAQGAPPSSKAFEQGQVFVQRAGDLYAIIDCGDHGIEGHGSHAHSDALSFELFACGQTFLRDPGSYVYTGSERWRNRFRSTEYHNTVRVDGLEISQTREGELFALQENVRPTIDLWKSSETEDLLRAAHASYSRLPEPIVHNRSIRFNKIEGYWSVTDCFSGAGQHRFEFFFNFDSGIDLCIKGNRIIACGQEGSLVIAPRSSETLQLKRTTRWVSPGYGTRMRASGIIIRLRAEAPVTTDFLLIPCRHGDDSRIEQIIKRFEST